MDVMEAFKNITEKYLPKVYADVQKALVLDATDISFKSDGRIETETFLNPSEVTIIRSGDVLFLLRDTVKKQYGFKDKRAYIEFMPFKMRSNDKKIIHYDKHGYYTLSLGVIESIECLEEGIALKGSNSRRVYNLSYGHDPMMTSALTQVENDENELLKNTITCLLVLDRYEEFF